MMMDATVVMLSQPGNISKIIILLMKHALFTEPGDMIMAYLAHKKWYVKPAHLKENAVQYNLIMYILYLNMAL